MAGTSLTLKTTGTCEVQAAQADEHAHGRAQLGEEAVRAYIAKNGRRHAGHRGIYHASSISDPIKLEELNEIVEVLTREGDLELLRGELNADPADEPPPPPALDDATRGATSSVRC